MIFCLECFLLKKTEGTIPRMSKIESGNMPFSFLGASVFEGIEVYSAFLLKVFRFSISMKTSILQAHFTQNCAFCLRAEIKGTNACSLGGNNVQKGVPRILDSGRRAAVEKKGIQSFLEQMARYSKNEIPDTGELHLIKFSRGNVFDRSCPDICMNFDRKAQP